MIRTLGLIVSFLLTSVRLLAQDTASSVDMADQLRADGKIWVVVAVIAVTFAGIVYYLIRLDGKISKLEKEIR